MQFEIDCRMMHHTAGVYAEDGRGSVVWPVSENEGVVRTGDWNDYLVEVIGNRYRSRLNGVQIVDFTDPNRELPMARLHCNFTPVIEATWSSKISGYETYFIEEKRA